MDFLKYEKVSSKNTEMLFSEIEMFLPYYLFNDKISSSFNNNIKDLFELSDDDFYTLKIVHFFLSDQMENFKEILPKLLKNLSHTTKSNKNMYNNIVKGRIDWNSTIKNRLSNGSLDNNLFVCTTASKIYDLEENQLLKHVIKKIIFLFKKIKFAKLKSINYSSLDENEKWYETVNEIFRKCEKSINKVYFDEISDISHISIKHRLKCIKNRNQMYFKVYELYKLYEDLFVYEDKKILLDLINTRLIKATNPDKIYEIYIFFKLVSILPNWKMKLMHENNKYFASGSLDNDVNVTIYYQKTPDNLKNISKYLKILENYEHISGNVRSPDIIIEFESKSNSYYRIVEVKNVSDGSYLHDALYKVMGYYNDFCNINYKDNCSFTNNYPIVLICWKDALVNENYDIFDSEKYIILDYGTFNKDIEKLIQL